MRLAPIFLCLTLAVTACRTRTVCDQHVDCYDDEVCLASRCQANTCGDDIVRGTEECDDGAANSDTEPNACRSDCLRPWCGDGVNDTGEQCDDGNQSAGDGCDPDCRIEFVGCGDGTVDQNETCDDGNTLSGDGCSADCLSNETCGNGYIDTTEDCDDGNLRSHDGCSSRCAVEYHSWVLSDTAVSPPARHGHELTYDPGREVIVLFGGREADTTKLFDDTWEYDGNNWVEAILATKPTGRFKHGMAMDTVRGRVVLFGGLSLQFGYLDDTWEYDGLDWVDTTPTLSPAGRWDAKMAFDAIRGVVVLFGGHDGTSYLADSWEYDGTTWLEVTPPTSPSPRGSHAFTFDSSRGRVVMFGGFDGSQRPIDTWEYNGSWLNTTPVDAPPGRTDFGMAYDSFRGRVVLFGGAPFTGDTWEYDGLDWVNTTPLSAPGPRHGHAMAFDANRFRIVVFGGVDEVAGFNIRDTWEYQLGTEGPDEICGNGSDDDLDGVTDCDDPDCQAVCP